MDNIVNGVGGSSPTPFNKLLAVNNAQNRTTNSAPAASLQVVNPSPVQPISYWTHPNLFVGLRNAFLPLESIDKFIAWQKEKLEKTDIQFIFNSIP